MEARRKIEQAPPYSIDVTTDVLSSQISLETGSSRWGLNADRGNDVEPNPKSQNDKRILWVLETGCTRRYGDKLELTGSDMYKVINGSTSKAMSR